MHVAGVSPGRDDDSGGRLSVRLHHPERLLQDPPRGRGRPRQGDRCGWCSSQGQIILILVTLPDLSGNVPVRYILGSVSDPYPDSESGSKSGIRIQIRIQEGKKDTQKEKKKLKNVMF
jgi:hypothetical protein